jgi:hypothetical protein
LTALVERIPPARPGENDLFAKLPEFDLPGADLVASHGVAGKTAMKLRLARIRMPTSPPGIPQKGNREESRRSG